jgi:nicotinate-nucleotide pyrophosphorylase (carboxylating)
MVLIKDNHIDVNGGVEAVLEKAREYLRKKNRKVPIVLEVRNKEEIERALAIGIANRLLLDNFSPAELKKAVAFINKRVETEASGGINLKNIRKYAATGVDFISVGALTHSATSLDLSLKISR